MNEEGRVKNILVNDVNCYTDLLARSLCQNGINYVQIENEFHFDDMIYRIYGFDEYLELCSQQESVIINPEQLQNMDLTSILDCDGSSILDKIFLKPERIFNCEENTSSEREEFVRVPVYTKKKIHQENIRTNQGIKYNFAGVKKTRGYGKRSR